MALHLDVIERALGVAQVDQAELAPLVYLRQEPDPAVYGSCIAWSANEASAARRLASVGNESRGNTPRDTMARSGLMLDPPSSGRRRVLAARRCAARGSALAARRSSSLAMLLAIALACGCGRIDFEGQGAFEPTGYAAWSTLAVTLPPQRSSAEPLVDFPLLVVLDDSRARRDLMSPDGADLRFFDASGQLLAHELEQVGAPGAAPLLAWVRLPRVDGTSLALIAAYGGAVQAPRAALSPWSKEFAAVWHFDETALASARDATGTGHTGAARGTRLTAGLIGQGRAFTAAAKDAVVVADAPELTFETFTISAWTRYDKPPGQLYFTSMSRQFNAFGENELFLSNFAGKANAEIATTAGSFVTSGGALPLSRWVHLAAVYDGVALTLYVDGRPSASLPASGRPARTANPLFLGADRNNGSGNTPPGVPDADFLDGALDEVRVERTARSAAWQEASYLAMQDQAISYGPVQLALP